MSWIPPVALIFSAIAVVVSVVAAYHAHRSATASEDSALSARRSADADQRQAALAEEEANRYHVPWVLESDPRSDRAGRYRLINKSDEPAHNVRITGDVDLPYFKQGQIVRARESVYIVNSRGFGETEPMSVTWRRPPDKGGEEQGPWEDSLP
ncbi:hypothetical protein AB0I72_19865 [Nocardiopsis sp. NPDC049922]|uniref:hypothetical protein n=1 Tax=Nocardiopsis sp. NPDC049922 TaxID=3155157 RepID=UPI0033E58A5E